MFWESKPAFRSPNASTWRRNSSLSEAIRNSMLRRLPHGKKGRFSRNRLQPRNGSPLPPPALETIERLFSADENSIAIIHGRGVDLLVKCARREYLPLRLIGYDAHHALLACEVDLPVTGNR